MVIFWCIGFPALLVITAILFYEFGIKKFIKDIDETFDKIENPDYKDF